MRIGNSICPITVTEKRLKTSKIKVLQKNIYIINLVYIDVQNSKSNVHFHRPWPENLDYLEKNLDYREYEIRRQDFFDAGSGGTCSAPSALHFTPRCLQSALSRRLKLGFGPEKLIKSTFTRQEVIIQ